MKKVDDFQKTKKWRYISIYTLLILLLVSIIIPNNLLKAVLLILSFVLSFIFSLNYKCPHCGKTFDIRISSDKLKHCSECGANLQKLYSDDEERE